MRSVMEARLSQVDERWRAEAGARLGEGRVRHHAARGAVATPSGSRERAGLGGDSWGRVRPVGWRVAVAPAASAGGAAVG